MVRSPNKTSGLVLDRKWVQNNPRSNFVLVNPGLSLDASSLSLNDPGLVNLCGSIKGLMVTTCVVKHIIDTAQQ